MPYRRLPNTDEARLRALHQAYKKAKELPPFQLAFSQSTYQQTQSFLPLFEKTISEHRFNYTTQVKRGKEYQQLLKKVRTYTSHFIQVMNMAVQRGELPSSTRSFYGMKENDNRIPGLTTENDIIEWGERIIKGEAERVKKGLSPITNPTIGKVKVWYDNFVNAFHSHKTTKKTNARYIGELGDLRKNADEIIVKIWDEVEAKFKNLKEEERREKAAQYGIAYVFRKNEISKLAIPGDAMQVHLAL
jgi:hypothetical protein